MALNCLRTGQPFRAPCVILSGGETTVTLGTRNAGRGGRNSEFLLSFAQCIAGVESIFCLAADTDGIDGTETNAGGFADGSTVLRIRREGGDPGKLLRAHNSWKALHLAQDIFMTGPTGTNVNDFRSVLIC
jgi:hydroxypyruvate reductase